jgi:type VI secretion system protein ImpF
MPPNSRSPQAHDSLTPSLLERLRDQPTVASGGQVLEKVRECIRNELEDLLNTRWRYLSESGAKLSSALKQSLVDYGLPDFLGGNLQGAQDPKTVCEAIKASIERFEPRLKRVRVEAVARSAVDRTLSLRIEAELRVEPWHDRVQFNTVLEPTGQVSLSVAARS